MLPKFFRAWIIVTLYPLDSQRLSLTGFREFKTMQPISFSNFEVWPCFPLLESLHWLRISKRIGYKLCRSSTSPQYLAYLLYVCMPSRQLRSSDDRIFRLPTLKIRHYRERSSSFQGQCTWNKLPQSLRHFNNNNNNGYFQTPILKSFKSFTRSWKRREDGVTKIITQVFLSDSE